MSPACSAALLLVLTSLHTRLQEPQLRVAVSNLFGNPAYLVAAFRSPQPSQRTLQQRQALAKLSASEQMMATEHGLDVPRIAHMYHAMLMVSHRMGTAAGLSLLGMLASHLIHCIPSHTAHGRAAVQLLPLEELPCWTLLPLIE